MRHKLRIIGCLALAGIGLAGCETLPEPQTDSACHWQVAWDPYEPYSWSNGGDRPVGYDIDVVAKVADMMNCSLEFTELAWSDILEAIENGTADVTAGTGYHADRTPWSWYSESYRKEVIGLMVRANTAENFAGGSLRQVLAAGLVFGKTTDDTYDESLEALFAEFGGQVAPRVSEADNIRRLIGGAIDGFLVEKKVGAALATRLGVRDAVEFHPLEFVAGDYRLQMSKQTVSARQLATINASLQALAANSWLDELLSGAAAR